MDASVFDVIKIELDSCYLETEHGFRHKEFHRVVPGGSNLVALRQMVTYTHNNTRSACISSRPVWCNCVCALAEEYNAALVKNLKEEIAKQLGLSIEDEQNEDAE